MPVGLDDSKVDFGNVFVSDADVWSGIVPDAFDRDIKSFSGDVFDDVVTKSPTDALETAYEIALQGKNAFPESIGVRLCHNIIEN
ncbi:MAG: hypothetical protein ACKN82_12730, partial [Pirellula sp.]